MLSRLSHSCSFSAASLALPEASLNWSPSCSPIFVAVCAASSMNPLNRSV